MDKGSIIKRLREEKGFTQVELANKVGVSKQTLYKYENNIITNIPSDKVEALARELKTSPSVLMGWEDPTIIKRYAMLDDISAILQKDGYDLDCDSYDDNIFIIRKMHSRQVVATLSDAALLSGYEAMLKNGKALCAEDIISLSSAVYYTNPETARIAQEMFDDPEMRSLFHMKRNMDPKKFQAHYDMMKQLYALEHPEDADDFDGC